MTTTSPRPPALAAPSAARLRPSDLAALASIGLRTRKLRAALSARRRVHLRYYVPGRDEATERDVDPMRLLVVEGRPYLEGWCLRAEGVRLFRLDRVLSLDVLDVPSAPPAEAEPVDIDQGLFREYYEHLVRGYARGVRAAQLAHEVDARYDPEVIAFAYTGIGNFVGMRWADWTAGGRVPDDVLDDVLEILARGLAPKDPA